LIPGVLQFQSEASSRYLCETMSSPVAPISFTSPSHLQHEVVLAKSHPTDHRACARDTEQNPKFPKTFFGATCQRFLMISVLVHGCLWDEKTQIHHEIRHHVAIARPTSCAPCPRPCSFTGEHLNFEDPIGHITFDSHSRWIFRGHQNSPVKLTNF
jgi:hypothetical protein